MKISRDLPLWKAFELLVTGPADVLHAEQIKHQMVIYLQNFGSKDNYLKCNSHMKYT